MLNLSISGHQNNRHSPVRIGVSPLILNSSKSHIAWSFPNYESPEVRQTCKIQIDPITNIRWRPDLQRPTYSLGVKTPRHGGDSIPGPIARAVRVRATCCTSDKDYRHEP